jgi:hypothetical protein
LYTFLHFPSLQHSKHHILLLLLPKIIERGGVYSLFWKKIKEKNIISTFNIIFLLKQKIVP